MHAFYDLVESTISCENSFELSSREMVYEAPNDANSKGWRIFHRLGGLGNIGLKPHEDAQAARISRGSWT